jgi:hypothetical protein
MKLTTVALVGAGYVLGARAGRARYDQLSALVRRAAQEFQGSEAQRRLEQASARLEAYARDAGSTPSGNARRAQSRA